MADQGIWFKLWCSALMDPGLSNLDIADFGRWAKLGALLKQQGDSGSVQIQSPALHLCSAFQVASFDALIAAFQRLPHVALQVETGSGLGVTVITVTMSRWSKYQLDYSGDRVRRFRARRSRGVTVKKRREEIRREVPPKPPGDLAVAKETQAFVSELTQGLARRMTP